MIIYQYIYTWRSVMDKPKPKSIVSDIIDEMISLTKPKSKQDIQDELARDKINYLIWTIGVAVKDLQEEIDKLDNNREAS
jgi:hypothetical protein